MYECDCLDFLRRSIACKHIHAVHHSYFSENVHQDPKVLERPTKRIKNNSNIFENPNLNDVVLKNNLFNAVKPIVCVKCLKVKEEAIVDCKICKFYCHLSCNMIEIIIPHSFRCFVCPFCVPTQ